jgi:hypothetical protein
LERIVRNKVPTSANGAIESFANAVFDSHSVEALEAYSSYGVFPRRFESADQLAQYIKESLSTPKGIAYFFVVYPNMDGRPIRKKIQLKPNSAPGETFRYAWEGWGLISVILRNADHQIGKCSISANSKNRAEKWSSIYPEWPLPDTWNWAAVERHSRRLRSAMKAALKLFSLGMPVADSRDRPFWHVEWPGLLRVARCLPVIAEHAIPGEV